MNQTGVIRTEVGGRARPGSASRGLVLAALALTLVGGCREDAQPSGAGQTAADDSRPSVARQKPLETLAQFRDVTEDVGVRFTYRDGQEGGNFAILESLGGGVALF